ncbi:MAG TPA: endolytic transglycosylase MltG [Pseudonocardiaceae bacterium]|nr:endolytic transglycosylase MltG [Pseudonocardiaceae bacterium]
MSEGLGLFDEDVSDDYYEYEDEPPQRGRGGRAKRGRKRSRKVVWTILLVLVVLIAAGAYFGVRQVIGLGYYPDFSGAGTTDVVFEVNSGDTLRDVGDNMQQDGIVASANAFVKAAKENDEVSGVQPGFYLVKEHMSGAAAVEKIVAPKTRVGQIGINSGTMLDDTTATNGKVTSGILSKLAQASCATINGRSTCLPATDFQAAIQNTSPAALGVPSWAIPTVTAADPRHKLEGLLVPGVYNIKPGATAVQDLSDMLSQSAAQLQADGLPSTSQQQSGFSPYQLLTIASIVERESGTTADMPKVARVLYNRLAQGQNLQLDSTVDYALDRPMVRTAAADQTKAGAYDTYHNPGLPPTPISSPSAGAIQAAIAPASGPWLFFVVCQKDGTSCFATTFAEHQQNITLAQQNGAY